MATIDQAFEQLWKAVKATVPLNTDAAIYKEWRRRYGEWGSPVGSETQLDDGGVFQVFTHAIVTWDPQKGVQVVVE